MKKEKYPYALSWPGSKRGAGARVFNTGIFLCFCMTLVGTDIYLGLHWSARGLSGAKDIVATLWVNIIFGFFIFFAFQRMQAAWLRWKATEEGILFKRPFGREKLLAWDQITRGYIKDVDVLRESRPVILLHKTYTLPRYFSTARSLESFLNRNWLVLAYTPQAEEALKGHVPLSNAPERSLYGSFGANE